MDSRKIDRAEDSPMGETPEDVAVLYSWANLHGAKYRDFSASRREYRAQLRHRAAEQAREQELRALADAEAAASIAEGTARQAEHAARLTSTRVSDQSNEQVRQEAEEATRMANAERIEAARRAEAAALAEAAARREEREIAEAHASARRQAARYADSEIRRRESAPEEIEADVPGQITDPYTPQQPPAPVQVRNVAAPQSAAIRPAEPIPITPRTAVIRPVPEIPRQAQGPGSQPASQMVPRFQAPSFSDHPPVRNEVFAESVADVWEETPRPPLAPQPPRRPRGYRPDDASGVRQIYRGPEPDASRAGDPPRQTLPARSRYAEPLQPVEESGPQHSSYFSAGRQSPVAPTNENTGRHPGTHDAIGSWTSTSQSEPAPLQAAPRQALWAEAPAPDRKDVPAVGHSVVKPSARPALPPQYNPGRMSPPITEQPVPDAPQTPGSLEDPGQRRRRQDFAAYQPPPVHPSAAAARRESLMANSTPPAARPLPPVAQVSEPPIPPEAPRTAPRPAAAAQAAAAPFAAESATPAWLYATQEPQATSLPYRAPATPTQNSVADTLQQSRERVASRWYALKGVFEQPGQERSEPQPVRQKETRTPVLAVFSLAGGVGKTSLVATLGRSLSSLGEKVLLTDTTSHGLLPFYFGASELRQGTVRTFSPPSGSTDAPIYLVSYDVEEKSGDEEAQDGLVEEINGASRGTHRVLLDLTVNSGWVARRMASHKPIILVPVAPDMNSVISLQGVERFFAGITDGDGKPLQIFYVLNQFDASLPLHLDVREVLRRQLGDRLLPTVIRRAPAVSEALAEGMTIIDYSPEAPVAEDYLGIATWLRSLAAPATAGFRNVRWSER